MKGGLLRDAIFLTGFVLLAGGLAMWDYRLAMVVSGVILMVLALAGIIWRSRP